MCSRSINNSKIKKMDSQTFFNVALGLAAFFGGWVLNNITKAIERLDVDVRQMPHTYIAKNDYRRDIDEIKEMLGKIFDKLDAKVDK